MTHFFLAAQAATQAASEATQAASEAAQAASETAQATQPGGSFGFLLAMIAIFAIMYFFMIRPQQKRQKEIRNFQNSLTEGTAVVTSGGIYGTVKKIDLANNIIEVKIADGMVVRVDKSCVYKDMASTLVQK